MDWSISARAVAIALIVGAVALPGPAAAAGPALAGHYRLHDGPNTASELVLKPDGKFDYFLTAGSLDEMAHGLWRAEGNSLRLQTLPKPVPPSFAAGPITSVPGEALVIHVTAPSGEGISAVYFTLGFDSGEPVLDYTQDYGWSLTGDDKRTPRWIEFSLPIYALQSQRFAIDRSKGNSFNFILTPNDLGKIDFSAVQIDIQPHAVVMHRWESTLTYRAD